MAFELAKTKVLLDDIKTFGKAINTNYLLQLAQLSSDNSENHPAVIRNLTHFQTLLGDYLRACKMKDTKFHAMPVVFETPKPYTAYTISTQLVQAMSKSVYGLQAALKDGVAFHLDASPTGSSSEPFLYQLIAHDLKGRAYRLASASSKEFGWDEKALHGSFEDVQKGRHKMFILNDIVPEIEGEMGLQITSFLDRLMVIDTNIDIIRSPDEYKDIWYCNASGLTAKDESGFFEPRENQLPFMAGMLHPMLNAQVAKHAPDLALKLRDALVKQSTLGKIIKTAGSLDEFPKKSDSLKATLQILDSMEVANSGLVTSPKRLRDKELNDAIHEMHSRSPLAHETIFNNTVYFSGNAAGFRFDQRPAYEHKKVNFYPSKIDPKTGEAVPKKTPSPKMKKNTYAGPSNSAITVSSEKVLEAFNDFKGQGLQPQQIAILILAELEMEKLPLDNNELKQISSVIEGMKNVSVNRLRSGAEWFAALVEQKVNSPNTSPNKVKEETERNPNNTYHRSYLKRT